MNVPPDLRDPQRWLEAAELAQLHTADTDGGCTCGRPEPCPVRRGAIEAMGRATLHDRAVGVRRPTTASHQLDPDTARNTVHGEAVLAPTPARLAIMQQALPLQDAVHNRRFIGWWICPESGQ